MTLQIIAIAVSILSIILGFIALLSQKIYLDAKTQKPTEIKVAFLGKMKTNYPSLIFVFLGFALVFYLLDQHFQTEPVLWKVSGFFTSEKPDMNWSPTQLSVFPRDIITKIDKDTGRFDISLGIKKGNTFEEEISVIIYTDKYESGKIIPRKELEKYDKGDKLSLLDIKEPKVRIYKVRKLEKMQEE